METVLTLGVMAIIFLLFGKIIRYVTKAIMILLVGVALAVFTKATLATGIIISLCIVILLSNAYKSFFKIFKKLLTWSKKYKNGFIEKLVDLLFSINISLLSIIWLIVIINTGIVHSFDISFLIKYLIYAMVSTKLLSLLEGVIVKK